MALVKVAHGRDEADALPLPPPFASQGFHRGDGPDDLHRRLPAFRERLFFGASSAATSGLRW